MVVLAALATANPQALNESPSEKEGKSAVSAFGTLIGVATLNESPSEKEGKLLFFHGSSPKVEPSMKVPPKRKGN